MDAAGFRSRLRLPALAGAAAALLVTGVVAGAAGSAMILGAANDSGTDQTTLTNNGLGAAFTLKSTNTSTGATGIFGWSSNTGGNSTRGVYGRADGPHSYGVYAVNNGAPGSGAALYAAGGNNVGVYATTTYVTGAAIQAINLASGASEKYGLYAQADGSGGEAVYARAIGTTGLNYGVRGRNDSDNGAGVYGESYNTVGQSDGVGGQAWGAEGAGVHGYAASYRGVWGETADANGVGVYAQNRSNIGANPIDLMLGGEANTGFGDNGNLACDLSLPGCDIFLFSNDEVQIQLDNDNNESGDFTIYNGVDNKVFGVSEAGNVTADGTYTSPAADMAELLPGVAGLEAGDVLVVGVDGKLHRSSTARDVAVVGVYSTKPAFLGGMHDRKSSAGSVPVAIVGVVPVKVSAENGAIKPGDLLVTSGTAGHAMRAGSSPTAGTILGKALGSLNSGTGTITMLVLAG